MKDHIRVSSYVENTHEELLAKYDAFILAEARKVFPLALRSKDTSGLDVDELAQIIRVKLWHAFQKQPISHVKAYIRAIARTAVVDMLRRHKPEISLFDEIEEDLCLCDLFVAQNEGFRDPAYEVEFREIDPRLLNNLVEAILSLPSRQKQAMFSFLKENPHDMFPLINAFKAKRIDVEERNRLNESVEKYLLKASLSVARKRLQKKLRRSTTA